MRKPLRRMMRGVIGMKGYFFILIGMMLFMWSCAVVEGGGEVGERSYVYVAGGPEGLFIIDVTDPENPELAGHFDTDGLAKGVYVSGDYTYVADWLNGFVIVDVSDTENPQLVCDMIWMTFCSIFGM